MSIVCMNTDETIVYISAGRDTSSLTSKHKPEYDTHKHNTDTDTRTHTHTHTHRKTQTQADKHTCTRARTHTQTHAHTYGSTPHAFHAHARRNTVESLVLGSNLEAFLGLTVES